MLATHEAQVIPVTWIKHFCVFSSSGTSILVKLTEDLGVWDVVDGGVGFLRCEVVLLCDACLLCKMSLMAES